MKLFISLVLIFNTIVLSAQLTKPAVVESGDKYSRIITRFSVLKDNDAIKHGTWQRFRNDKLIEEGAYDMNRKDSTWKTYNNEKLLALREYTDGERVGKWKFFKQDGSIEWAYDWTTQTVSGKPFQLPLSAYQGENAKWINDKTENMATRLTGVHEWFMFMVATLRYPVEAIDKEVQGRVDVEITLDETGMPVEYGIAGKAPKELIREALRIVQLSQPEIVPFEINGKKVKVKIQIPVTFRLEN
jgi:TonB family protein